LEKILSLLYRHLAILSNYITIYYNGYRFFIHKNILKGQKQIVFGLLKLLSMFFYFGNTVAFKNSRFMRAIFSKETPLGHSTSQAPVLVQLPKPSASI